MNKRFSCYTLHSWSNASIEMFSRSQGIKVTKIIPKQWGLVAGDRSITAQAQLEIPGDMMAGSSLKSAIKKRLWSDGEQTVLICINKWLTWLLTNDKQSKLTFKKLGSGSIFSSISSFSFCLISSILNSDYDFIYLL